MVKVTAKLPTQKVIQAEAQRALLKDLNSALNRTAISLTPKVREILIKAIKSTGEYLSIQFGKLGGEIGMADIAKLDAIIDLWANSVKVIIKPVRSIKAGIRGGFTLVAIQRDWADALAHPAARITTEKGVELPWLEWLLTFGNKVIVRDYGVTFDPRAARRGRTGRALMVRGKGRRWRVPPGFAGTARNNFVTRALETTEAEIVALIQTELIKQVK